MNLELPTINVNYEEYYVHLAEFEGNLGHAVVTNEGILGLFDADNGYVCILDNVMFMSGTAVTAQFIQLVVNESIKKDGIGLLMLAVESVLYGNNSEDVARAVISTNGEDNFETCITLNIGHYVSMLIKEQGVWYGGTLHAETDDDGNFTKTTIVKDTTEGCQLIYEIAQDIKVLYQRLENSKAVNKSNA